MFEKVNPKHPDKIADRIGGAIVDLGYQKNENLLLAGECLIGHHNATIILETNTPFDITEIIPIVKRITEDEDVNVHLIVKKQDAILANNQKKGVRCGDNGIFKGVPLNTEERVLTQITYNLYQKFPYDGKLIMDSDKLIICQSNATTEEIKGVFSKATINPLGFWTGGTDVDTGAVNRKLGSDMGRSVTGGGLHFKDLTKGDVSINIYAFLKAQQMQEVVEISTAIGDAFVDNRPYEEIVAIAKDYITSIGGFEKFAEWGLIRPNGEKEDPSKR